MPDELDPARPAEALGGEPSQAVQITIKPLGTIILHGTAEIRDTEGNLLTPPPFKQPGVIKFCGCGRSGNKPFCDGSHKKRDE